MATEKVRFVGELLAMCVAPSRAEAEDSESVDDIRLFYERGPIGCPEKIGNSHSDTRKRAKDASGG